jgi:hypothetical protein
VVFSGHSTNKTDRHDITEILLKVALNTIKLKPNYSQDGFFNSTQHYLTTLLHYCGKTQPLIIGK